MHFFLLILFLCLGALCPPGLPAQDSEPTLRDLDALTGRWIALRGTLAGEKRQWSHRKTAWNEQIALLEDEAEALGSELDATREVLSTAEERRADLLARRRELETSLARMDDTLADATRRARALADILPPPLASQLSSDLRAFAEGRTEDLPRAQRAQRLVAFLSAVEAMQNQIHAVSQTLNVQEARRQVDVVYIGLARAFAVSPGDDWAAVGVPGSKGWSWSPDAADPARVRALVEMARQNKTAALATLPMKVEESP